MQYLDSKELLMDEEDDVFCEGKHVILAGAFLIDLRESALQMNTPDNFLQFVLPLQILSCFGSQTSVRYRAIRSTG